MVELIFMKLLKIFIISIEMILKIKIVLFLLKI